jgi:CheY-like chemotaxis protein
LIDDEPVIRTTIVRILADEHDVVALPSIREALELLERDRAFDVILSDLMMPDGTGMDLHEELERTKDPLLERLAILTGGACTERGSELLARVPGGLLAKPFTERSLRAFVRTLVDRFGERLTGP